MHDRATETVRQHTPTPPCADECQVLLEELMRQQCIEATVSYLPPIVKTPYLPLDMRCPHGVLWYAEPTSDQIEQWKRGGVV